MRLSVSKCLPVLCLLGIAGTFLLPGCGGGGGGGGSSPNPTPTPVPTATPTPLPSGSPEPTPTPTPTPVPTSAPVIPISIQPATITLAPQAQTQFTATIPNVENPAILWAVEGGSVSASGLYTAPVAAGTYHVTASSSLPNTQAATATVTVPVVLTVAPAEATTVSEPVTFTASVNTPNAGVTWQVQEGAVGGTITDGGVYTPPGVGGTFHVIATSVADGTIQATATVNVPSGGAGGVIQ